VRRASIRQLSVSLLRETDARRYAVVFANFLTAKQSSSSSLNRVSSDTVPDETWSLRESADTHPRRVRVDGSATGRILVVWSEVRIVR
jgi:hypothetical protein